MSNAIQVRRLYYTIDPFTCNNKLSSLKESLKDHVVNAVVYYYYQMPPCNQKSSNVLSSAKLPQWVTGAV